MTNLRLPFLPSSVSRRLAVRAASFAIPFVLLLACSDGDDSIGDDSAVGSGGDHTASGGRSAEGGGGAPVTPAGGGPGAGGEGGTGEPPEDDGPGWLAFTQYRLDPDDDTNSRFWTYLTRPDATGFGVPQRLLGDSPQTSRIADFSWAPDGRHLAVTACDDLCLSGAAWLIPIEPSGPGAALAIPGLPAGQHIQRYSWSPSGRFLLVLTDETAVFLDVTAPDVAIPLGEPGLQLTQVHWSPDGSRVAATFREWVPGALAKTRLVTWSADAPTEQRLHWTEAASFLGSVSWSPSGSRLAFEGTSEPGVLLVGVEESSWPPAPLRVHEPLELPRRARLLGFSSENRLALLGSLAREVPELFSVEFEEGSLGPLVDRSALEDTTILSEAFRSPQLDDSGRYLAFMKRAHDAELLVSDLSLETSPPEPLGVRLPVGAATGFQWIGGNTSLLVTWLGDADAESPGAEELFLVPVEGDARQLTGAALGESSLAALPGLRDRYGWDAPGDFIFFLREAPDASEEFELVVLPQGSNEPPRVVASGLSQARAARHFRMHGASRGAEWLAFTLGDTHWLAAFDGTRSFELPLQDGLTSAGSIAWQPRTVSPQPEARP